MSFKQIARHVQWIVSVASIGVGIAACSGEAATDEGTEPNTASEASTDEAAVNESVDPNSNDSVGASFCNGCYISLDACRGQVVPGSGCTCARNTCGCSGAVPFGMTCP